MGGKDGGGGSRGWLVAVVGGWPFLGCSEWCVNGATSD